MAEVTDVTIVAGIPTAGDGTVPTLSKTNTLLGAVNETAPATDIASSGTNGRLQRIAQRLTSLITLVPTALGSAAAAASLAVTASTEDIARVGIITEAAPANDTASSGLNGRLQRIAQRITSLIALLPTALGSAAAAASLATTASTEDVARTGIITETAPANDTASSGLNGRLQRVAQRISSLIALLPTALGSAAAAASLATTASTEDVARIGIITETAPATDTASSGLNGRLQRIAQRLTSFMATIGAGTAPTNMVAIGGIYNTTEVAPTNGQSVAFQVDAHGKQKVRSEPRMFYATFATMTRQANTTPYTALDAVSNNATAGSVTAQTATIGDINDDPIAIESIKIDSTDTGLGGTGFRAHLYRADPTASTGIVGGDNVAFSTKKGSWIGSFSGVFQAFSDGAMAVLSPDGAQRIVTLPVSGALTLYILYQTLDGFTPSANSTTVIATAAGTQGRI